ncbi:thioredoxin [Nitzschia inconspicua]|uniref:Thioredoxin n=1 Tax=Nitzschia inconspicua TaxID=303405 RepID=A0A9K3KQL2_9STRA|nr:thioredoxin [Nitzschia inconspicua]
MTTSIGRLPGLLLWWTLTSTCHAYMDGKSYSTSGKTTRVKRERNVDHWNSDTLAYYLDADYPGYDMAVMFYASWDQYSHALAPYWARIAELQQAGSKQSKLIMANFDCELNAAHTTLCTAVGVQAYPTMMFIGSGPFYDTDPITGLLFGKDRSAGVMGHAPVAKTVKFQGNWQMTDSILDWIRTMQALSRFHVWSTMGFGKRLRSFFFRSNKSGNEALPIGVPGSREALMMSSMASTPEKATTPSGDASNASVALLQRELDLYKNVTEELGKIADRTSTMMESILLSGDSYVDMFSVLDERNAWVDTAGNDMEDEVYRNCVLELSLDYCQRMATKVGTNLIDELEKSGKSTEEILQEATALETKILGLLAEKEPYCGILESCIKEKMKDEACRPKQCPFRNELACRYLTSCKDPSIMVEYSEALGYSAASSL